jgi:hypothetical protein
VVLFWTVSKTSRFGKMAGPTACETRWTKILGSFKRHRGAIIAKHPDTKEEIGLVHTALITIVHLVRASPSVNGNGAMWKRLAGRAEAEMGVLCKRYEDDALHTGLLHLYAGIHREMNETLLREETKPIEEFREQSEMPQKANEAKQRKQQ